MHTPQLKPNPESPLHCQRRSNKATVAKSDTTNIKNSVSKENVQNIWLSKQKTKVLDAEQHSSSTTDI